MNNPFIDKTNLEQLDEASLIQSVRHYRELSKRLNRVTAPNAGMFIEHVNEALHRYEHELGRRERTRQPAIWQFLPDGRFVCGN